MSTEILLPTQDHTNQLTPGPAGWTNYGACAVDDGMSSIVANNTTTSYLTDIYYLEDHHEGSGTISNVRISAKARPHVTSPAYPPHLKTLIRIGTTNYLGSEEHLVNDWTEFYTDYASSPAGGSWSWSGIDALFCGVSMAEGSDGGKTIYYAYCTYVWVTVTFSLVVNKLFMVSNNPLARGARRFKSLSLGAGSILVPDYLKV